MWNQRCFFTSNVKGIEENCSSNSYLKINGIFDDQNATYVQPFGPISAGVFNLSGGIYETQVC
jgi:hypothetical protein